ncbi:HMA2 domain-containing protein [Calothrix sp. UHCC 0171]|uniref:HMA2 domain-containing protein n=1 Tax=Calothrix sp. UHCC 0171 TaxID=3110245 RepID=UPI002B21E75A|nr:hypothetical protein [Calothrix sp. UHCC 0171]MEA5572683.1 hypothetical protein [Calothrix sp. UHCC 0171]
MKLPSLDKLPLPVHIQVLSITPGRIRLKVSHKQRQPEIMAEIVSALKAFFPQIQEVKTNPQIGSITLYYEGEIHSFADILTELNDFGIIVNDTSSISPGKSQAAAAVTSAMGYLNQRVKQTTNDYVDLRVLFSSFLALLALRQWLVKGPSLKAAPWYVLAWYAFDSFMKLNNSSDAPTPKKD